MPSPATSRGVRALPLLKSTADFDKLDGRLQAKIAVRSSGNSQRAMMSALSGSVFAVFSDGSIRGLNVAQMIRQLTSGTLDFWGFEASGKWSIRCHRLDGAVVVAVLLQVFALFRALRLEDDEPAEYRKTVRWFIASAIALVLGLLFALVEFRRAGSALTRRLRRCERRQPQRRLYFKFLGFPLSRRLHGNDGRLSSCASGGDLRRSTPPVGAFRTAVVLSAADCAPGSV